jgi:hypothetical protein
MKRSKKNRVKTIDDLIRDTMEVVLGDAGRPMSFEEMFEYADAHGFPLSALCQLALERLTSEKRAEAERIGAESDPDDLIGLRDWMPRGAAGSSK